MYYMHAKKYRRQVDCPFSEELIQGKFHCISYMVDDGLPYYHF